MAAKTSFTCEVEAPDRARALTKAYNQARDYLQPVDDAAMHVVSEDATIEDQTIGGHVLAYRVRFRFEAWVP